MTKIYRILDTRKYENGELAETLELLDRASFSRVAGLVQNVDGTSSDLIVFESGEDDPPLKMFGKSQQLVSGTASPADFQDATRRLKPTRILGQVSPPEDLRRAMNDGASSPPEPDGE